MLLYIVRRVLYAIPIAIAVGLVCFLLSHIAPGDPVNAIVSPDAPKEVVDQIRQQYGLDKPLPVQFGLWLSEVAKGNLGNSLATGRPVTDDLFSAFANTLRLSLIAAFIGFLLGSVFGTLSACYRGGWIDKVCATLSSSGVSVPHYWLGMLLVVIFSVKLALLPAMGAGASGSDNWVWDWAHIRFMVLPAITLAIIPMGIVTRTVRGVVVDVLTQDFTTTLRGKGLTRGRIAVHVFKNAAPAVIAIMALQLGYLMGGSILVETVFSWPGTGFLLNRAIFQRDIPILQGTILVLALVFVALNLLVDIVQTTLDPRIRRA